MFKPLSKFLFLGIFFAGQFLGACQNKTGTLNQSKNASNIIQRDGQKLLLNGKEIWLKGVSFGNEVWSNNPIPANHHNEEDFKRVKAMGMNVIRFYLNYKTL